MRYLPYPNLAKWAWYCSHIRSVKWYINNSRHLARKYARIFVRGHYLFREANSFPRAKLEENCELRNADIMSKDKYPSIFSPQMEAIIFTILQIVFVTHAVLKIVEYSWIFPSFSWGIFSHVTRLDQSRASKKIWWIIMQDISTVDTAFDWLMANLGRAMESRRLRNIVIYFRLFL